MKKRVLLAGVLTTAMMATIACSDMPGMGNTQSAAAQVRRGDSSGAVASDDKVYELKISISQAEQALITRNRQKLADMLNERSDGKLKVTVLPSGQFNSDEGVLGQAIQSANVTVNTNASRMRQYVRDFSILMTGYSADNYDECYRITQISTFKGWTDSLPKDHGIKILSFIFYDGPRHFMTNKSINTSDDLKGMRICTIGQEVCIEIIQVMGVIPVSMLWDEVYNGIQSKTLEGCEAQNTPTYPSRLYEACKYQSKTRYSQLM